MLRTGYVVALHPEDHSVDLVMTDNGERLVGVQVLTGNGSTRSGTVDLPAVPEKKDKWDITKETGQDQKAVVDYIGRNPVVIGFLLPQINQMTLTDPKTRFSRHQSDVTSLIDGDGNMQLTHPSGAYVRMGETPDLTDMAGKNFDKNLKTDRNTDRKLHVRVKVPGSFELTITPAGVVTFKAEAGATLEFGAASTIKAPELTIDGKVTITKDLQVNGNIHGDGTIIDEQGNTNHHTH